MAPASTTVPDPTLARAMIVADGWITVSGAIIAFGETPDTLNPKSGFEIK
jgi:hypothetical protein